MKVKAPVTVSVPIQWGDQDMFGHVNNIHFLKWFESARVEYLLQCGARLSQSGVGPILAAIQCDYIQQIRFPDTIVVGATVQKLGNSSLVIHHELWSIEQERLAARGDSTIVMFDYVQQQSVRIPDEIRGRIDALESQSE